MANEYAEVAELKATLELSGESFADDDIQLALTAASRGIDNACDRRFWLDTGSTNARYYTPDNENALAIDDLVVLTSLKTDPAGDGTFEQTWTVNTDFVLAPLNAAADGRPWNTVRPRSASRFYLPCVERSVEITGQFGWSAVPAEVKSATVILATKLMRRAREAPFGVVSIGLDGAAIHIARTDPDILFLLGEYMRNPIAVA